MSEINNISTSYAKQEPVITRTGNLTPKAAPTDATKVESNTLKYSVENHLMCAKPVTPVIVPFIEENHQQPELKSAGNDPKPHHKKEFKTPKTLEVMGEIHDGMEGTGVASEIVKSTAPALKHALKAHTVAKAVNESVKGTHSVIKMTDVMVGATKAVKATEKIATKVDHFLSLPVVEYAGGAIELVAGGFEVYEGIKDFKKGNKGDGSFSVVKGTLGVAAGVATFVGAAPVATALFCAGVGMSIGKFGDGEVERLGWLKDEKGKPQSASDRWADRMSDIEDDVQQATGSKALAKTSAVVSGIVMLPATGVVAVGGAVAGAGDRVWHKIKD